VSDVSVEKRSWKERLLSWTPWKSTKTVHKPVAYMIEAKDGSQIVYVSHATYKKWKDSGKLKEIMGEPDAPQGNC
jgi:hypothetical protein